MGLELNWSFDLNIESVKFKQLDNSQSGFSSTKFHDQTTPGLSYLVKAFKITYEQIKFNDPPRPSDA